MNLTKQKQNHRYRELVVTSGEKNGERVKLGQGIKTYQLLCGGAWWAAGHGVPASRTRLSDFAFTFHFHALEKDLATLSSVLAWRIPGTGEPGGLPSMGSHRVGHDWSDLAAAAATKYKINTLKGPSIQQRECNQYFLYFFVTNIL